MTGLVTNAWRSGSSRPTRTSRRVAGPAQLWAFWLAPLVGAAIAGVAYPYLFGKHEEQADTPVNVDALADEGHPRGAAQE